MRNALMGVAAAALLVGTPAISPDALTPQAQAGMLSADPVKNAKALLRYALPINNKPIRVIQKNLEQISEDLRIPGNKSLGSVGKRVRGAASVLDREGKTIIADFAPDRKAAGMAAFDKLKTGLTEFQALIEKEDKQNVPIKQQELLSYVSIIEESMVKGFPFEVPSAYANLPQLKGRATVEMKIQFATPRDDNATEGTMTIVADGYNAPLSAGDFIDLCRRGFYDSMEIQRADGFVVQTGKPSGDAEGFVENGEVRRIPFEVMVEGDKVPVYEETLEDNGRFNEQPRLPFNAFGTVALARGEFEANSASSQIFFLLKESELTPTGSNLLDGRYAVLGYITDNAELLKEIQNGDKIVYAKVTDGIENLKLKE
jgi:cyclophilin family peptidyl-prolyl cis-trans isomerase